MPRTRKPFRATNREHWLGQAVALARPIFARVAGLDVPEPVAVSCGFALGSRKAIGQAHSQTCSEDGRHETFVSPVLDEPRDVLAVLVHELLHHAVGVDAGHKAPFTRHLPALGISAGKPTATQPDDGFDAIWGETLSRLGEYPHAKLIHPEGAKPKQSTRQLKCECQSCGYICRTTSKWLEEVGAPLCPQCQDEDGAPLAMVPA